jgi:hypothetical protein
LARPLTWIFVGSRLRRARIAHGRGRLATLGKPNFFDQWEFYEPLFTHASLWRIFTWQHGPHREGIGLVLDKFVLDWTHWSNRAEALLIVAALLTAASVAVWLKVRIFGKLEYTDAGIPCLFLTLAPIDILIGVPNPSHSAFPELLIMLYCLAWLMHRS